MIKTFIHRLEDIENKTRDKDINAFTSDNKSFAQQIIIMHDNNNEELIVTTVFYESKSK